MLDAVLCSPRGLHGCSFFALAAVLQSACSPGLHESAGEALADVRVVEVAVGVDSEPHVGVAERLLRDRHPFRCAGCGRSPLAGSFAATSSSTPDVSACVDGR